MIDRLVSDSMNVTMRQNSPRFQGVILWRCSIGQTTLKRIYFFLTKNISYFWGKIRHAAVWIVSFLNESAPLNKSFRVNDSMTHFVFKDSRLFESWMNQCFFVLIKLSEWLIQWLTHKDSGFFSIIKLMLPHFFAPLKPFLFIVVWHGLWFPTDVVLYCSFFFNLLTQAG